MSSQYKIPNLIETIDPRWTAYFNDIDNSDIVVQPVLNKRIDGTSQILFLAIVDNLMFALSGICSSQKILSNTVDEKNFTELKSSALGQPRFKPTPKQQKILKTILKLVTSKITKGAHIEKTHAQFLKED